MANSNVAEAFDILIGEIEAALQETREASAKATQQGNYDQAETQLQQAKQIEAFIADLREKQQAWQKLMGKPRRSRKGARSTKRLPRGERTPEAAFRMPILRALDALGGESPVQDVLAKVYAEMESQLKPVDLESLPSDPKNPRWRNTAMWQRQRMVDDGLLRNDSPRGMWAITAKGRTELRKHKSE